MAASSLAPALLSDGFATIGRAHRYWPLLALPLALLAGFGSTRARNPRAGVGRPAAWAFIVCVIALALPSPVIASLALPTELTVRPRLQQALEGDWEQLLNVLTRYGDGVCAAAVPAPGPVFPYTGDRFLLYGHPEVRENAARIRWADIYDHIVPEEQRVQEQELLMSGTATPEQFREIVARYGLDLVVVPERVASATGFAGLSGRVLRSGSNRYVLYGLSSC